MYTRGTSKTYFIQMENKPIHAAVTIIEGGTHTSFHFKDATIGDLALINSELDLLKMEVLERIRDSEKEYEVNDYGEDADLDDFA